ncbi:thioredoxin family protein [Paenibacillus sp. 1-18]|uniref:thioredoxin family protein n=1 Tax=Paenibacillus sp. 1-18 TaxID=1333846 RepID=UPI0004702F63|nr:thioredoxin family protein [Paenibacillus sp. 1-18]
MKKSYIAGLSVIVLLLIAIAISAVVKFQNLEQVVQQKDKEIQASKSNYPEIYDRLNAVTFDGFKSLIQQDQSVFVYVGRPSCGDCNRFEPKFNKMIEQYHLGSKITFFNVHKIHEDKSQWNKFKADYNVKYTPTIAEFKQGKLVDKIEWTPERDLSTDAVKEWLISKKLIL